MRNDPDFLQSYDAILDNTQIETAFTRDEIKKLSSPRIDPSKQAGKFAIIAYADITFGISRMHEIVTENNSPHKISVFRDIGSALKWLDREGFNIEIIFEEIKREIT